MDTVSAGRQIVAVSHGQLRVPEPLQLTLASAGALPDWVRLVIGTPGGLTVSAGSGDTIGLGFLGVLLLGGRGVFGYLAQGYCLRHGGLLGSAIDSPFSSGWMGRRPFRSVMPGGQKAWCGVCCPAAMGVCWVVLGLFGWHSWEQKPNPLCMYMHRVYFREGDFGQHL